MRQQAGLTIYLGALYLLIACARRKPAMTPTPEAMDSLAIRRLPWCRTWTNYLDASRIALNATNLSDRIRFKSIALASLAAHFEGIEAHHWMTGHRYNDSPAHLDRRG